MPTQLAPWTRRQFAQTLAATAAASLLPARSFASPSPERGLAFVGSADHSIHVFHVSGSRWSAQQTIPAASPIHLTSHPTLPVLYAVHDVALWDNLPRGAVSAFSISSAGRLTLLNTQPLSLSATNPRHAAIHPAGTALAIAAPRAGIFNVLPIAPDGTLQPPAIIRKHLSPTTAATHSIAFLPDGKTLFTADSQSRPLHSFTIDGDFLVPTAVDHTLPTIPATRPSMQIPQHISSPLTLLFRPA